MPSPTLARTRAPDQSPLALALTDAQMSDARDCRGREGKAERGVKNPRAG